MAGSNGVSRLEARYRRAAVIAVLLVALTTAFVFGKGVLFGGGYEIRAVISDANQLRGGSEVRIGGDQGRRGRGDRGRPAGSVPLARRS